LCFGASLRLASDFLLTGEQSIYKSTWARILRSDSFTTTVTVSSGILVILLLRGQNGIRLSHHHSSVFVSKNILKIRPRILIGLFPRLALTIGRDVAPG